MLNRKTKLGSCFEDFLAELVVVFVCGRSFVLSLLQSLFVDDFLRRFLLYRCSRLSRFGLVVAVTRVRSGFGGGFVASRIASIAAARVRRTCASREKCYRKRGEN